MKSREEPCARSHFPEKEIKLKLGWGGMRWEASAPVMYLGTFLSRKQKQPSSLLCNLNSAKFYLPGTEASVSCVLCPARAPREETETRLTSLYRSHSCPYFHAFCHIAWNVVLTQLSPTSCLRCFIRDTLKEETTWSCSSREGQEGGD